MFESFLIKFYLLHLLLVFTAQTKAASEVKRHEDENEKE
jgi:hypothetical protein